MPITIQPTTLRYKNGNIFQSVDCLKGDKGDPGDPSSLIDDEAGIGDTDKVVSADKHATDKAALLNAINVLDNSKAPIIIDSASGAIATFPDGADDLPVESLIAEINPVQDLHGQSNPYPGGGGKNILPPSGSNSWNGLTTTPNDDGSFTVAGTATGTGGYITPVITLSKIIPANTSFAVSIKDAITTKIRIFINNPAEGTMDIFAGNKSATNTKDYQISAVRFYLNTTAGQSYNFRIYPQVEIGSTATAWSPYENICPISGWTGCNVTRTGKNLLDPKKTSLYSASTYGLTLTWDDDNGKLNLSGTYNSAQTAPVFRCLYVSNTIRDYSVKGFSDSANFKLLRWQINASQIVIELKNMVNGTEYNIDVYPFVYTGSAPSAYEPYDGDTYSISWQTEAGTVYGGTVNPVTGKLIVDRVTDIITKDSAWYSFSTGTGNSSAVVQLSEYQNVKYITGSSSWNGAISSTGKESQNYWTNTRKNEVPSDGDMCFAYSSTGQLRVHRTDIATITDLDTFKANFPDTQVCYFLATPIVYDLPSIEPIRTLLGYNAIFADTGDVDVEYRADTKLWIDGHSGSSITVDSALSSTSENPVQNKVINTALAAKEPKHNVTNVSGTTPSITGVADTRYICGEVSTLTIVVPSSGCIDVTFTSGSTPTVLTVTPPTGMAMKWANGFDPSSLDANTTYEINIMDGCLGVVGSWT